MAFLLFNTYFKLTFKDILDLEEGDMIVIEKENFLNPMIVISDKPKFKGDLKEVNGKRAFKIKSIIKRLDNE